MYLTLQQAVQDLQEENAMMSRVLGALTDASLAQPIVEDHRTLGQLAWHLATSFHSILGQASLQFDAPTSKSEAPSTAKGIADSYNTVSEAAIAAVQAQWTDATLQEQRLMFGRFEWPVSEIITRFIRHQVHHRGQLTVLMRQAGLVVPGIYGPSKEEWEAMIASQ
jgi:uncharacterized damage-inducible protein DinB